MGGLTTGQIVFWACVHAFICGCLCGNVADTRGRSPQKWFWLGFLFAWFAVLIVLALPDLKHELEHKEVNRRLAAIEMALSELKWALKSKA